GGIVNVLDLIVGNTRQQSPRSGACRTGSQVDVIDITPGDEFELVVAHDVHGDRSTVDPVPLVVARGARVDKDGTRVRIQHHVLQVEFHLSVAVEVGQAVFYGIPGAAVVGVVNLRAPDFIQIAVVGDDVQFVPVIALKKELRTIVVIDVAQ